MSAAHINRSEIKMLLWLRENTNGCGEEFAAGYGLVRKALSDDSKTFSKQSSYLAGLGLIEIGTFDLRTYIGRTIGTETRIWLTALGEKFLREMESVPSGIKSLTLKVFDKIEDAAIEIAARTAAKVISG